MVDALVESQPSVEKILKFSDMFLRLKDLTTSQAFQVEIISGLKMWCDLNIEKNNRSSSE